MILIGCFVIVLCFFHGFFMQSVIFMTLIITFMTSVRKLPAYCIKKERFFVKRKTASRNLAISATCETEGRNARLLLASGNAQQVS